MSKHQPYGNVKMKGKKTKKLSCTCCVAVNKKKYSNVKEAIEQLKDPFKQVSVETNEILPCPMCGSAARLDSTAVSECYGKDWQTIYIECTKDKDEYCGMELAINADFWYMRNAEKQLIKCWNGLDRK